MGKTEEKFEMNEKEAKYINNLANAVLYNTGPLKGTNVQTFFAYYNKALNKNEPVCNCPSKIRRMVTALKNLRKHYFNQNPRNFDKSEKPALEVVESLKSKNKAKKANTTEKKPVDNPKAVTTKKTANKKTTAKRAEEKPKDESINNDE